MSGEPLGQRLAREWEQRARSPYRDFYVASHRGWDDPARWNHQAWVDAGLVMSRTSHDLAGCIGTVPLGELDVLEIGCGTGRLAERIAPYVRSYSGCDISQAMVDRSRAAGLGNARFVVSDGLSIPTEFADRRYGLVFSHAVFVHCPRAVVRALVLAGARLLAKGGQFRSQFRTEAGDRTPAEFPRPGEIEFFRPVKVVAPSLPTDGEGPELRHSVPDAAADLIYGTLYRGEPMSVDEMRRLLEEAGCSLQSRWRIDDTFTYGLGVKGDA